MPTTEEKKVFFFAQVKVSLDIPEYESCLASIANNVDPIRNIKNIKNIVVQLSLRIILLINYQTILQSYETTSAYYETTSKLFKKHKIFLFFFDAIIS